MTVEQFIAALGDASTYADARAVVSEFDPDFRQLTLLDKNRCRRAWKERQAVLAETGEIKPSRLARMEREAGA